VSGGSVTSAQAGGWDRVGIVVSVACAIHCTLLPVAAGLLPLVGFQHFADERIEWAIIVLAALVGFVGHARAYIRHHHHLGPALMFVAGLSLVISVRLTLGDTTVEPIALGSGGLLAAGAHWANIRLCRCCTCSIADSNN
jgi:hypothetical protein